MPDPMTLLKADHREVKKLLEALGDSEEGNEREQMVEAGIQHHVDEEEKEILPELKSDMERQQWMAIGDQIVQAKEQAGRKPSASTSTRRSSRRTTARKT